MVLEDTTVTPVAAAPPIETVAPDTNPVPVIVIAVPPAAEPILGETLAIEGKQLDVHGHSMVPVPPVNL
jgi:hypothetical protein